MDELSTENSKDVVPLKTHNRVWVRQIFETIEFFGFETRNKYAILDEQENQIAFATEVRNGFLDFVFRQFLGHWRSFEVHFFTPDRKQFLYAKHPFRFLFPRLEVINSRGKRVGSLQSRFSLLHKKFDVENATGVPVMEVASPIWRIWTFPFVRHGKQRAQVLKKWSGTFSEVFSDRDNFMVEFSDANLTEDERQLILAAAVFIDLKYFERKAGN